MTCCEYFMAISCIGVLLDCFFVDREDSLNCCHSCCKFRKKRSSSCGTQVDEDDCYLYGGACADEALLPQAETEHQEVERYDIAELLGGSVRHILTGSPI